MSTSDSARPTLSLRSPEDLIAIVPYLVGFDPADSLVVIGLKGIDRAAITRALTG